MTDRDARPVGFDPEIAAGLIALLEQMRTRYPAGELERIEHALAIVSGAVPRPPTQHRLQNPGLYVPGLSATPWHDGARLEAVRQLEHHAPAIIGEVRRLLAERRGFQHHRFDPALTTSDEAWNALYLRYDRMIFEDNRAECPITTRVTDALPGRAQMAFFSALQPGAHIRPHCGPTNLRLTIHLGCIVPPGCEFRVGDEIRTWREGRCLVFDDSFEHEVWNRSNGTRIILLVDIWHPDLTPAEIEFLAAGQALDRSEPSAAERETAARRGELVGRAWWME